MKNRLPPEEILRRAGIPYVVNARNGKYTTTCPKCRGKYLNVKIDRDGACWFCRDCEHRGPQSGALSGGGGNGKGKGKGRGGGLGDPVAIFDYEDEFGRRLFQVLRFEPPGRPKTFRQRTGPDQVEWSIEGVRRVLFKLPELVAEIAEGRVIFVVEGEKDVLILRKHGVPATTKPMGAVTEDIQAKGKRWLGEYSETLRGADVVLCGDNDAPGREHMRIVARCFNGVVKRLRVLDLAAIWRDIKDGDDVSDWFDHGGGTVEKLWAAVEQLPDYAPQPQPQPEPGPQLEPPPGPGPEPQGGPQQAEPLFDPWERFIVPAFPLDILSPVLREFVVSQSRVIGGCLSGMAMATLDTVRPATSHRWSVKMMEYGQWYVHPRLWVLLVGDPSTKKTPEMNAATAPLEDLQTELYRDYREALRQYKEGGDDDAAEREPPEPPPRYIVMDTTIQKLGEIVARADRGLLVKRDELTGWIGDMDRYNKAKDAASDRAFWLKAWDGGPYHVDRIGRGEIFIENLSVSIVGGIQPDRLAELKDLTTDGLLQRFLPTIMTESNFTLDEPANVNPYW